MDKDGDRTRGTAKTDEDVRSAAERKIALELEIQHLKARVTALQEDIEKLERNFES